MNDIPGLRYLSEKILVLNDKIYGDSVGIPTLALVQCLSNVDNLFTFIMDKRYKGINLEGKVVNGIFPPFSTGWYLNLILKDIVFRKTIRFLHNVQNNHLIHYASQQFSPLKLKYETVTVHDLIPIIFKDDVARSIYRLSKRNYAYYKNLPVVMTVSNFIKESMLNFGFKGEIIVIPNTFSPSFRPLQIPKSILRQELNLPQDKKLILSVSANYPWKNLALLERVMANLGDNYKLVRVGPSLQNSINFHRPDSEKLNRLYNACDVLAMPSLYEGFGLPLLEAMASGLPAVVTDLEVFKEIAGESVVYSEPDYLHFSNAIREVIDNGRELIQKGISRAEYFSFPKYCERLIGFYRTVFKTYDIKINV